MITADLSLKGMQLAVQDRKDMRPRVLQRHPVLQRLQSLRDRRTRMQVCA